MTLLKHALLLSFASAWLHPAAVRAQDHEDPFRAFWHNTPIANNPASADLSKWRADVRRWHQSLNQGSATKADQKREDGILAAIGRAGATSSSVNHVRAHCRISICEYVVILKKSLSFKAGNDLTLRLQAANEVLCPEPRCKTASIFSGGGPKGDGVAMLFYLVGN